MTEWIQWDKVDVVLEYGPGTGSFTGAILERKRESARFLAIEINGRLIQRLKEQYPNVEVYEGSVADVVQLCELRGITKVDAIVCGLPWASFSGEQQREYMNAMTQVLSDRGYFCTFAYLQGLLLPAGQRFSRLLKSEFRSVARSEVIWGNIPPAFVYRCRR